MAAVPAHSASRPLQLAGASVVPVMPQPADDLVSAVGSPPPKPTGQDVVDTGWNNDASEVGVLVDGISNEEIWMLVRRLNKVAFHVKTTSRASSDGLDLGAAADQEFSPNKMRAQLERLYMGIIVSGLSAVKHLSRLRSWNEKTRTGAFCLFYFAMWALDYLMPAVLLFLCVLINFPKARAMAFPPAPISMVGSLSGNLTKPNAGVLGSVDSITGAPENMKGEAVENEASNFVTGLAAVGVNIMSSGDVHGEPNTEENSFSGSMKASPNEFAQMIATGKDKAEGIDRPSIDKSKGPMETIMWSFMRSGMTGMDSANDTWEKLANAVNPKPPFTADKLSAPLVRTLMVMLAVSVAVNRSLFLRSVTFSIGVVLFGAPLLNASQSWLGEKYPDWIYSMSVQSHILHGVPNNNQLALALLRHGEKQKAPLPPPPTLMSEGVSEAPIPLTENIISAVGDDLPLGASPEDLLEAAAPDYEVLDEAGGDDTEVSKTNSKEPHKVLRIMKGAAKLGVRGSIVLDKTRAKLGHPGAKNRLGVVPSNKHDPIIGPVEFEARYEGRAGVLSIDSRSAAPASLAFKVNNETIWSVPVSTITALRKHAGYGFKTKMTAGWALDKRLNDSLGITDSGGNDWAVTAIPNRDALFNRLIAIGEQNWELM